VLLLGFFVNYALGAVDEGTLSFSIGNRTYQTKAAVGAMQPLKDSTRIFVGVKDRDARFLFSFTVDIKKGSETETLTLTTYDHDLSVVFRSQHGAMAILPEVQLVKENPNEMYVERVEVDSGTMEEVDDRVNPTFGNRIQSLEKSSRHKRQKKIYAKYRLVKPRWHTMTKEQRIASGEGIIKNKKFENTFFAVTLKPVVAQGKIIAYEGSFSGIGRFAKNATGAEFTPIKNGEFFVKVENVR